MGEGSRGQGRILVVYSPDRELSVLSGLRSSSLRKSRFSGLSGLWD